jgi:hypothetical protein
VGRKAKALFDTLLRSVRFLECFRCCWPLDSRDVDEVSAVRDSLWVRLRCAMMQVKYGDGGAQAYEENFLGGKDKLERAAAEKGNKAEGQGSAAKKQKKRGSGGGGQAKKCHQCGGSSHLIKDYPKTKASSK